MDNLDEGSIMAGLVRVEIGNYWDRYQEWTHTTAVYPDAGLGSQVARDYACLGLQDESGELAGKFKKALRGDTGVAGYPGVDRLKLGGDKHEDLLGESGDVLYYAARYCVEHGLKLGTAMADLLDDDSAVPKDTAEACAAVKQITAAVGRCITCIDPDFEPENDEDGYWTFRQVLYELRDVVTWSGLTLEQVAEANQVKLNDRLARGVIKGSGDKR